MKAKIIITSFFLLITSVCYSQLFLGDSKASFAKYIKRVYEVEHNEGCKVYQFNEHPTLITIASVKKGPRMQRAGELKALRNAGEFLKGSNTVSVSKVEVTKDGEVIGTPTDIIITNSVTSIDKMEILSSFPDGERMVYIYIKKLEKNDQDT